MPDVVTTCPKCRSHYAWNSDFQEYPNCPQCGFNQMKIDRGKWQGCCAAIQNGDIQSVKRLLNDPDIKKNINAGPWTFLHLAVIHDHIDIVRFLLREGAYPNMVFPQTDNETALHAAASRDRLEIADVLIRSGAQVDPKNSHGKTPLDMARDAGFKEVVSLLAPHALRSAVSQQFQDAAWDGNLEQLRILIAEGADVNAKDSRLGRTPLHAAAAAKQSKAVALFLESGADVSAPDDKNGFTPLHLATDNFEVVRLLLSHGADVNARDHKGQTPLHHAFSADTAVLQLLLDAGADARIRDNAGKTPIQNAFETPAKFMRKYGKKWWQFWG